MERLELPRLAPQPSPAMSDDELYEVLTSKQQAFVAYSFSGMSDVDAYRASYDTSGMTPKAIGRAAHDVAHNPAVTAKLKGLMDERNRQTTLAPRLSKEWIIEGIATIAQTASKENVRLAAYVSLGKIAGIDLFRETTRVERVERSADDVDRELRAHLKQLGSTIDGVAVERTPSREPVPADRRRRPKS